MFWNIVLGIASYFLQLVLAPKPQNAKAASLEDFNIPVAEEGIEIPVVFGTVNIRSPNVVWYGDLHIDDIKGARRYGFFGPRQVIGHHYRLGMHMVLCHGVHDEIREIWAGGKKIFPKAPSTAVAVSGTVAIDQADIFGGDEGEGGIWGFIEILTGSPGQAQNAYLASVLAGADTPAFRGVVSVIWEQLFIGNNAYIKPWEFVLKRIHLTSRGEEQWYDAKAAVPDTPSTGAFDTPDPNDELDAPSGGSITDYGNATTTDYHVSVGGSKIVCWKFPDFSAPFWTADDADDPQSVAVDANGNIFTAYAGEPLIKVWDITDGTLKATVTLVATVVGNTGLTCITTGGTTTVCLFCSSWILISGSGTSWTEGLNFDGPNWLTQTVAGCIGGAYVYAIKGGSFETFGNVIYRAARSGFTAVTEVTLVEVDDEIFAVGYHIPTNRVVILDTVGKVHIYSADLTELLFSSPGGEDWTHAGAVHSISNGMFTLDGRIVFVAQTTGSVRSVVQYNMVAGLVSLTNADDVGYLNDNGDVFRSQVDPENNFIVVWGNSGSSPLTAWEIPVGVDALDMNPAHIIRECLTDRTWGMGYNVADIDDDSFTAAADTLYDECFGLSLLWTREERIEEFITVILAHIDAFLYLKRTTGKFFLKLIRNDYNINDLPIYDEDDVVSWDDVVRREPPEAVNSVIVKYTDRRNRGLDASISYDNIAQIQQLGERISATRFYPGISRGNLAVRVAGRDQKSLGIGMISGRLTGKRTWDTLYPGDPFRLVSARHNLDGEVMRVAAMKFGDGRNNKITVQFAQDVFHLNANELVDASQGDWENPANPPAAVSPRLVWEMPYLELKEMVGPAGIATMLADDPDAGMIEAAGARPTADTIDASIYVDGVKQEVMSFAPTGLLDADITAFDTAVTITDGSALTLIEAGMLAAIIGTTPAMTEIVRINAISGNDLTLSRGMLDTVPQAHSDGDALVVFDDFGMSDFEQRTAGATPDVQLVTRTGLGSLSIGAAPVDEVNLDSRAIRPLRPVDVQVEGDDGTSGPVDVTLADPFEVTWANRNRLTETTPLAWTDASVALEASATITIALIAADGTTIIDDTTYDGLTGTSANIDHADFLGESEVFVRFTTVRGGYGPWQAYQIPVSLSALLLLEGDMTDGDDNLLLQGDMTDGNDLLRI